MNGTLISITLHIWIFLKKQFFFQEHLQMSIRTKRDKSGEVCEILYVGVLLSIPFINTPTWSVFKQRHVPLNNNAGKYST